MEKKILEVKNLSKSYYTKKEEIKAIEDISLCVNEGDFIAIVGPSGCGKSSILNILSGLDKFYKGSVEVFNNKTMGYMLQNDALFDFRTILDNCLLSLEVKKELTEQTRNYVINLLDTYGLGEFKNNYPKSLSGGMKQRTV